MNRIVVDAPRTLSWCFPDEQMASSMAVLDQLQSGGQAVVPAFWAVEVLNSVLLGERKGRIAPDQAATFLNALKILNPVLDYATLEQVMGPVQIICRDHRLTPYDALYIELRNDRVVRWRRWIKRSEMQQPPSAFTVYDHDRRLPSRGGVLCSGARRRRIFPVTELIAERWGHLAPGVKRRGVAVGVVGGVLAATALGHDLTLVTRNVKDFADPGVVLLNAWDEA